MRRHKKICCQETTTNMRNQFLYASVISFAYFVLKFMEMRFVDKENKPLKLLVRETVLVYCSVLVGLFVLGQVTPLMHQLGGGATGGQTLGAAMRRQTPVFTDNPSF